jgi:hypothetical protein
MDTLSSLALWGERPEDNAIGGAVPTGLEEAELRIENWGN